MRKHGGSSSIEMREDLGNEGGGGGRGRETASIVAGNPRVIWDHPGSRRVWGGVCMCMHMCVLGLGAGRQAEKHLLWTPGLA